MKIMSSQNDVLEAMLRIRRRRAAKWRCRGIMNAKIKDKKIFLIFVFDR